MTSASAPTSTPMIRNEPQAAPTRPSARPGGQQPRGQAAVVAQRGNAARTASSSSTTSPLRRTSASESYGVGPCVTIASRPPARQRHARQRGHRVDLQRGAHAQHQVGLLGQGVGLGHGLGGQQLAEQHHVRLERRDASPALGRAVGALASISTTSLQRHLAAALQADALAIEPCTSTTRSLPAARCSRSMFWVMTPAHQAPALELGDRLGEPRWGPCRAAR